MKETLVTLSGAAIGGTLGFFAYSWLLTQGYYGMILPGGLLGMGAAFGRPRSVGLAIACGLAALSLGLFAEWHSFPFQRGESFTDFISHIFDKDKTTILMISIGGLLGFWMPFRRADEANGRHKTGGSPKGSG